MEEIARSSEHNDLTALDELFQAALERVSNFLGRFSVGFSCEGGVLMRFVRALQTCAILLNSMRCVALVVIKLLF